MELISFEKLKNAFLPKSEKSTENQINRIRFLNTKEPVPQEILAGRLKPNRINPDGTMEWYIYKFEQLVAIIIYNLNRNGDYQISHVLH